MRWPVTQGPGAHGGNAEGSLTCPVRLRWPGGRALRSATPLPHRLSTSTLAPVSSLWTPGGEHKVPRPDEPGDSPSGGSPPGAPPSRPPVRDPREEDDGAGEREPTEEEIRELARQLAAAPPEDVIANHCYGLFELAALHLSQSPVNVPAARLAIDAMGLLVDGLGSRLGAHSAALADGLTQLRLAFVRITDALAAAAAKEQSAPPADA
jgi:hypothetical protein